MRWSFILISFIKVGQFFYKKGILILINFVGTNYFLIYRALQLNYNYPGGPRTGLCNSVLFSAANFWTRHQTGPQLPDIVEILNFFLLRVVIHVSSSLGLIINGSRSINRKTLTNRYLNFIYKHKGGSLVCFFTHFCILILITSINFVTFISSFSGISKQSDPVVKSVETKHYHCLLLGIEVII